MQKITNSSPNPTFIKNADSVFVAITDGFMKMFSIDNRKQVVGKKSDSFLNKKLAQMDEYADKECLKNGISYYTIPGFDIDDDGNSINLIIHKVTIKRNNQELIIGRAVPSKSNHNEVNRFKAQLKYFLQLKDDIMAFAYLDLTAEECLTMKLRGKDGIINVTDRCSFENYKKMLKDTIADDELKAQFDVLFTVEALKEAYESGMPCKKLILPLKLNNVGTITVCQEYIFTINPFNNHLCLFLFGSDISAEIKEKNALTKAAEIDSMTGIYNHAAILGHISDYIKNSKLAEGEKYAFAIFDINKFKHVNDIFGHKIGDDLLIKVANWLKKASEDDILYGRLGGDEFVFFDKHVTSLDELAVNIQKLLNNLQFRLVENKRELIVSASIGVYIFDNKEEDIDSIYIKADKALYKAKTEDGPSYCIYNDSELATQSTVKSHNPILSNRYSDFLSTFKNCAGKNIAVFHLNLTQNTLIDSKIGTQSFSKKKTKFSADEFFEYVLSSVRVDKDIYRELTETMTRKYFLLCAERGEYNYYDKFNMQMRDTASVEHHRLSITLAINPKTQDTEAICIFLNDNIEHYTTMVANKLLKQNFTYSAIINVKDKTIRHLSAFPWEEEKFGENFIQPYEESLSIFVERVIMADEQRSTSNALNLNTIINELRNSLVYTVPINIFSIDAESQHKILQFSYLDDKKTTIYSLLSDFSTQANLEYNKVSGLLNRRGFFSHMRKLLESNPDTSFVLVRWDIDCFKLYNDIFGMNAGDEILASIGNAMKQYISDTSVIGNLSADIFALCLEKENFKPEELLDYITNLLDSLTNDYYFTFHMAAYEIKDKSEDITIMCDRAQLAEESIKSTQNERFIWYNESMYNKYYKEQTLLLKLRESLTESPEDFVMQIQPQYNILTKRICGGESLVRWKNPGLGLIAPGTFVPLLEKTNLISKLDVLIWEQACQYLSERLKADKPVVPISINISRCDFRAFNVPKYLNELTERYDIPHKYLYLEVTESAYTTDGNYIINIIKKLRRNGFIVEMDDFGSGYSSLNTLKTVPLDTIKIDMRFFDIEEDDETGEALRRGNIVVSNIVRLAKELRLSIIAEGIETKKQADFLHKINCPVIQGYLFSKPIEPEEFSAMLDSKKQPTLGK